MADLRPKTVAQYIQAAPPGGRPHVRRLYTILKSVAPKAKQVMKWGTPFFIEPRFLFAFSAHKAHMNFVPMPSGLKPFSAELKKHRTTKGSLQIPYDKPFPADLVRRIAKRRAQDVAKRNDDGFW